MDKQELKTLVAQLLREMDVETPKEEAAEPQQGIRDLTQVDLRQEYHVQDAENGQAFVRLKKKTPARLGLGRCGARYRTDSMLRFRADHAAAQDSVFSLVPKEFYERHDLPFVQTMCKDKDQYLTRPDLGRRFDAQNQTIIRQVCGSSPKVLLVIGDGLSSDAITANAADCAAAIRQGLKSFGIELGKSLFIQYARVGAMDHIGELTNAELICMLVGERPGLATSESMSAYITYQPRPGISEAKRTVVSNIHRQGTPAVEAGAHIAELLHIMLQKKASGIDLR
ncbi:MAG: ethanolamine ammonia-lyase subunit EutC [Oscillospiraceae bacterium]|nr:ethanolamine ammonia-lyase subunit EutC [Oscillospiraceae bacterium]